MERRLPHPRLRRQGGRLLQARAYLPLTLTLTVPRALTLTLTVPLTHTKQVRIKDILTHACMHAPYKSALAYP